MDIDFHYGTVYVLARWAKFGSENANLIASASQLVDDNFDSTPFSDEEETRASMSVIPARISGATSAARATARSGSRSTSCRASRATRRRSS